MQKLDAASPQAMSTDFTADNVARLKALFPELVTEGPNGASVDVDVLKALVGERTVGDADERYGFHWHGKRSARQAALTPSTGTLRPCPDDSVAWDDTRHLVIEGDNLDVMKLLHKSYAGKVKLVYIDPPYNTGSDFVYPDDFSDSIRHYLAMTGQTDAGVKRSTNTEANGRFHTDWLNMMYPRLKLAHALLSDEGLIAVHIDEHEVHALVLMLREIFGEENELGVAVWDKRNPKGDARGVAYQHESLVLFARNAETLLEQAPLKRPKRNAQRMLDAAHDAMYRSGNAKDAQKAYRAWMKAQTNLSGGEVMYDRLSEEGRVYRLVSMAWPNKKKAPEEYFTPLTHPVTGKPCAMPARGWRNPPATMQALIRGISRVSRSRWGSRGRASRQASPAVTGRPRTDRLTTMVSIAVAKIWPSMPIRMVAPVLPASDDNSCSTSEGVGVCSLCRRSSAVLSLSRTWPTSVDTVSVISATSSETPSAVRQWMRIMAMAP